MIFSISPVSEIAFRPSRSAMEARRCAGRAHLGQDLLGEFAGKLSLGHHGHQFAEVRGSDRALGDLLARGTSTGPAVLDDTQLAASFASPAVATTAS